MNALTFVVLAVVAWLFFLSGSSFLFLLSLAVLVLYSLVEVGGQRREARAYEPAGTGKAMEEAAGTLGNMINALGSFFGGLFIWTFRGEKKKAPGRDS
jgi:predicted MFS family arabinose efflux permease